MMFLSDCPLKFGEMIQVDEDFYWLGSSTTIGGNKMSL